MRKLGGMSTGPSIGNTGLLSSTSVATSSEPTSTNSGTNSQAVPSLVVTQIDGDVLDLVDGSHDVPGTEVDIDHGKKVFRFYVAFLIDSQTPSVPPTHMPHHTSAVLTAPSEVCAQSPSQPSLTQDPALAFAPAPSQTRTVIAPPAAVPRPDLHSEPSPIGPMPVLTAAAGTTASSFSSDAPDTVSSGTTTKTAPVPRPICRSAALVSGRSSVGSQEVPRTSDSAAASSQIPEPVPLASDSTASTKGPNANQTVIAKKGAKMRPNNSLTPRYVIHP
jgi:hypothetical protein